MSLASFSAGTQVWFHKVGYTVSEIYQDQELAWHCVLIDGNGTPRTFLIEKLFDELRVGNLRTKPPKPRPKELEVTPRRRLNSSEAKLMNATALEKAVALMRRWILNFLVSNHLRVSSPADWSFANEEFVRARAEVPEGKIDGAPLPMQLPSIATLNRWHSRFAAMGLPGLLSRAKHRGGKGRLRVDTEVVERMTFSVDNYFLVTQRRTIRDCWLQLKGEMEGYNAKRLPAEQIKVPSYSTYRRFVLSLNAYEVYASRFGRRAAEHRFRSTEVGAGKVEGLNDLWLVDHFLLRVIGMHKDGTAKGRPWVTIITDARTRYIVGIRVGYESLSTERLLDTIFDAIMPKDQERLAAMGVKSMWYACGTPVRLRMDNGSDLAALDVQRALTEIDCADEYCAVRSPWTKGAVERCIQSAHSDMAGMTGAFLSPATIKAFSLDRDPKLRPSQMPLMEHEEIEAAVHRWAIDEYNNRAHTKLGMKSPCETWRLLATPDRLDLPCDQELIRLACMRQLTPTIQSFGLQIAGLRSFNSPELQEIRKHLEHSMEERVTVKVRYRPSKLDVVWVQDPRDESWFSVENKDPSTRDLSVRQVSALRAIDNLTTSATSADYAAARKRASDYHRQMNLRSSRAYRKWVKSMTGMAGSETAPTADHALPEPAEELVLVEQPSTQAAMPAKRSPAARSKPETQAPRPAAVEPQASRPPAGPRNLFPRNDLPIPDYKVQ